MTAPSANTAKARRPSRAHPKVSVIGAAYNHERFVVRAIESALRQDYPNLQIVMVDDGSTDGTQRLAEPYGDRILYVRKENGGLISSVNRLYELVEGEFVTFCGGDDELVPGRVWEQLRYLEQHPEVGLVYSDVEVIDADSNLIHPSFFAIGGQSQRSGNVLSELFRTNFIAAGGVMLRSSMIEHFHPIPTWIPFEDWWTSVNVASVAEIHYLPGTVYRYRYHGNNMNLFAEGEKQAEQAALEARFRQILLTTPRLADRADLDAIGDCVERMVAAAARAVEGMGAAAYELLGRDEEAAKSASHDALEALRDRDFERAVRLGTQAFAHDPWNREAQVLRSQAIGEVRLRQEPLGLPARSAVVIARGSDLLADRSLLPAYAEQVSGDDDATLVVLADRHEVDAVADFARETGLADAAAADVVLTTEVDRDRAVAHALCALGGSWPTLRHFDASGISQLRSLLDAIERPAAPMSSRTETA